MKKIIIAGGRDFTNYDAVCKALDSLLPRFDDEVVIISGGAKGGDVLGERYAREHGLAVIVYSAVWDKYGPKSGPSRNEQMGAITDHLVAFWDGQSKGTEFLINFMKQLGRPVHIFDYAGNPKT